MVSLPYNNNLVDMKYDDSVTWCLLIKCCLPTNVVFPQTLFIHERCLPTNIVCPQTLFVHELLSDIVMSDEPSQTLHCIILTAKKLFISYVYSPSNLLITFRIQHLWYRRSCIATAHCSFQYQNNVLNYSIYKFIRQAYLANFDSLK